MMKRTLSSLFGLSALFAIAGTAQAAPQVLAVLSPPGGVVLTCGKGGCQAELTAYCLQRDRESPDYRQDYRAADPKDFVLTVRDAAGSERRIPVAGNVEFASDRGFMSVVAVVRPETVARLGIVSGTLVAGEVATLVPASAAGDKNPLTPEEVANATGNLRTVGQRIVDRSPNVSAALALADVKRRLPPHESGDTGVYADLWRETSATLAGTLAHPDGLARARVGFNQCMDKLVGSGHGGMRRCLEWQHDHLIREINKTYWDAQAGS